MLKSFLEVVQEVCEVWPSHSDGLMVLAFVYQISDMYRKRRKLFAVLFRVRVSEDVMFFSEIDRFCVEKILEHD